MSIHFTTVLERAPKLHRRAVRKEPAPSRASIAVARFTESLGIAASSAGPVRHRVCRSALVLLRQSAERCGRRQALSPLMSQDEGAATGTQHHGAQERAFSVGDVSAVELCHRTHRAMGINSLKRIRQADYPHNPRYPHTGDSQPVVNERASHAPRA